MPKNRITTWLLLIVVAAVLAIVAILGFVQYMGATATPLHPDPKNVPSATDGTPSPKWVGAVEQGRQLARAGLVEQNLPGLSVAVGIDGEIVWAEGFGWANVANKVPVAPNMRFRIGHVSKVLTSAALGLLIDQGRIHLGDEIQKYVPTFPRKRWSVTLRELMAHTAGLKHYTGEYADVPSGHCDRASEGLQSFADDPLLFEPDTQSRYSTYGWVLLSAAVEAVAGEPFFTFMRTQILAPLGMTATVPDSPTQSIPDRVTFYFPRINLFGQNTAESVDYSCFAGAGAYLSTPSDLVRFGLAMTNGRLLQPATIRMLQTRQELASGKETGFGLGWTVETVPLLSSFTTALLWFCAISRSPFLSARMPSALLPLTSHTLVHF